MTVELIKKDLMRRIAELEDLNRDIGPSPETQESIAELGFQLMELEKGNYEWKPLDKLGR